MHMQCWAIQRRGSSMINMEINLHLRRQPTTPATVAMHTTETSTETLRRTFPLRNSSTFSSEEGFPQVSSCVGWIVSHRWWNLNVTDWNSAICYCYKKCITVPGIVLFCCFQRQCKYIISWLCGSVDAIAQRVFVSFQEIFTCTPTREPPTLSSISLVVDVLMRGARRW